MSHFDSSVLQKLGVYNEGPVAEMNDALTLICMQIFFFFTASEMNSDYGALRRP